MAESIETGFVLMLAGMGTVFLLLAMLVWIVQGVSKLSRWLEPRPDAVQTATAPTTTLAVDRELLSVIGAAVKAHRDRRRAR